MTFNGAVDIKCDQKGNQKTSHNQRELKMFIYLETLLLPSIAAIHIINSNHSILNPNLAFLEVNQNII